MKIVFLDSATLGPDVSLGPIAALGELVCYESTSPEKVFERISDCEVLIVNKVKIGRPQIDAAPRLRLICEAATGVNILERLYSSAIGKDFSCRPEGGSSVYCHLVYKGGILRTCGEKEFSKVRSPSFGKLFGSDLSISDYSPGSDEWRATLIFTGKDRKEAESGFDSAVERIRDLCIVNGFSDESPEVF